MEFLSNALRQTKEYKTLLSSSKMGATMAMGLSRVHKCALAHALGEESSRPLLLLVSDEGEALRIQEDLASLGRESAIFPSRDLTLRELDGVSREYERKRIGVLSALLQNKVNTVIAPVDGAMLHTIPKETLEGLLLSISVGDECSTDEICKKLTLGGYKRASLVEGHGQFSLRGGILDVFVPGDENPYRFEFWGDSVDSVAIFDIKTQRRLEQIDSAIITPANEVLPPDDFETILKDFANKTKNDMVKTNLLRDLDKFLSGLSLSNMDKFLPLCYDTRETLFDYMEDALICVCEPSRVAERVKNFIWQQSEDEKNLYEEGQLCRGLEGYILDDVTLWDILKEQKAILLETFAGLSVPIPLYESVAFNMQQLSAFSGLTADLSEEIMALKNQGCGVVVLAGLQKSAEILAQTLREKGINATFEPVVVTPPKGSVVVTTGGLSAGMVIPSCSLAVITLSRGGKVRKRRKTTAQKGTPLASLDSLTKGDLVVHSVYGIGVFEGINKIETAGVTKDYIKIKYLKDDILYVPVTQMDLVSRYIGGGDEASVRLNKLGSDGWQKTKARVRKEVKEMAKELIALYAKRMSVKGHAFSEDTDLQRDFETRFPYDETEDQLKCVDEIKADMERPIPMDRLLCGDVGFGKTEVALRAAFKCIAEGKQCAFLVPTTILAWQHYKTILSRMEGMAVNIEMLSRFRTPTQQRDIKAKMKDGRVDLVVGTHKLIAKDIKFKDLGLLIVDEEQRFGVAQKERMKELFPNVDVLTLSATPIPRTLNMAMSGLRDMSLIEEAPLDRHPVQTYVLQHNRGVLLDAIRKELNRGGQVYYLHNRVETITRTAARLQADLPDAAIDIAHGQMSEEELSEVWRRLIDGEIDVLVCTTIIETGVDVANANTLIIENADLFGLAQLHQLRGRVGRSSRRAYAYLTFRAGGALSEIATKRLEAIRQYTEFGSGFKIAMADLEIRGAGDVLGSQQHGHMESVGYDMYLKLLSNAVSEENGEELPQDDSECLVDLQVGAHIPENYIESLSQRLQIYRRIASIKTQEDCDDVFDELLDRYGEPPKAVLGLIDIALLRQRAHTAGITEINDKTGNMHLFLSSIDLEKIGKLTSTLKGRVMFSAGEKPYLAVRTQKGVSPIDALSEILDALEV